jgi:hypothetical protein
VISEISKNESQQEIIDKLGNHSELQISIDLGKSELSEAMPSNKLQTQETLMWRLPTQNEDTLIQKISSEEHPIDNSE